MLNQIWWVSDCVSSSWWRRIHQDSGGRRRVPIPALTDPVWERGSSSPWHTKSRPAAAAGPSGLTAADGPAQHWFWWILQTHLASFCRRFTGERERPLQTTSDHFRGLSRSGSSGAARKDAERHKDRGADWCGPSGPDHRWVSAPRSVWKRASFKNKFINKYPSKKRAFLLVISQKISILNKWKFAFNFS